MPETFAIPFWEHGQGDPVTLPCTHLVPEHPGGDQVSHPCAHIEPAHPGGHSTTTPCVHPALQHPQGHNMTTPCLHMLVQQHAHDTVLGARVPCVHLVSPHPTGHTTTVPCTHPTVQHPGGDTTTLPCAHLVQRHPGGDATSIPCTHLRQEHPAGHSGPAAPCVHWLSPVREEFSGRLKLYFADEALQQAAIDAYHRLKTLGLEIGFPRPLHVFNREPVPGAGTGSDNPFWSHYNPAFHSIQLMKDGSRLTATVETLHHEMGHAVLGHSIVNHYTGGPHRLKERSGPTLAMSEGWAHFVALVLRTEDSAVPPAIYKRSGWETMDLDSPSDAIEYCVGACLWDLFDERQEDEDRGRDADRVSLSFQEIFSVYSPDLQVLMDGVVIQSIHEYLDRLKRLFPDRHALHAEIDQVRRRNVG